MAFAEAYKKSIKLYLTPTLHSNLCFLQKVRSDIDIELETVDPISLMNATFFDFQAH